MKNAMNTWRPSAPLTTTLTAVLVIAGLLLAGWLNARRYRVRARVEIAEPVLRQESTPAPPTANAAAIPDGEVARMAVRVREASGLLLGLTVLAVSEQLHHRAFSTANALLASLNQRQLLPPGLFLTPAGTLQSDVATLAVRYRAQPFGLEVLSLGRVQTDGPPLLVRLETGNTESAGALLLIARKYETPIPAAFASLAQINALHWKVEPLRESPLASPEMEQLQTWAQRYANQGK